MCAEYAYSGYFLRQYQKFVTQAKKLNPRYLTMIIPARWYAGGKGLDDFRNNMLHDRHISHLHDFLISSDCFPGVQVEGGVCFFLWDKEYNGEKDYGAGGKGDHALADCHAGLYAQCDHCTQCHRR